MELHLRVVNISRRHVLRSLERHPRTVFHAEPALRPNQLSKELLSFSQNEFLVVDTQTAVLVSTAQVWISAPDTKTSVFLVLWVPAPLFLAFSARGRTFPKATVAKDRASAPAPYANPTVRHSVRAVQTLCSSCQAVLLSQHLVWHSYSPI